MTKSIQKPHGNESAVAPKEVREKRKAGRPKGTTVYTDDEILEALIVNYGSVYRAARYLGIHHSQIYNRLNSTPDLKAAHDALKDQTDDFVEGQLMRAIEQGNIAAIIFYLKTQSKKKWSEKSPLVTEGDESVNITVNVKYE